MGGLRSEEGAAETEELPASLVGSAIPRHPLRRDRGAGIREDAAQKTLRAARAESRGPLLAVEWPASELLHLPRRQASIG